MTPDTKTLSQIAALKLALQDLETRSMYRVVSRDSRTYAAVLNAIHDLTGIDAIYDAFDKINPDNINEENFPGATEADVRYDEQRSAAA